MNVLVIPARWGSSRFPGKPLAEIAGVPMVVRVLERVIESKGFDNVLVATDDNRVLDCLFEHGYGGVMTSSSCRNGTERCAEVAEDLRDDDIVVNVQGDEPLMDVSIPQRLLYNVGLKPGFVWTAVRKLRVGEERDGDVVKAWVKNGLVREFSRDANKFGNYAHVGVYGYTVKRLREYIYKVETEREKLEGLEQLRWEEPIACITVGYDGIGVDRPADIYKVEGRLNGREAV